MMLALGSSAACRRLRMPARVNLGTSALEDPAWCERVIAAHGDRIAAALDVRVVEHPDGSAQHRLAGRGLTRDGGDLWASLARLDGNGCARYVVTDVSKDGMLRGPNVEPYRAVTGATTAPVVASGGFFDRRPGRRWPRSRRRARTWRAPLSVKRSRRQVHSARCARGQAAGRRPPALTCLRVLPPRPGRPLAGRIERGETTEVGVGAHCDDHMVGFEPGGPLRVRDEVSSGGS